MIGYRSLLNIESDASTLQEIERLTRGWLEGKGWTAEPLEFGRTAKISSNASGRIVRTKIRDGNALAYEFTEVQESGTWTTKFLIFVPDTGSAGWALTEIDSPARVLDDGTELGTWIEAPGLVKKLIEQHEVTDNGLPITLEVQTIRRHQVAELVAGIQNPNRRNPVIVSAIGENTDLEIARGYLRYALQKTAGLAAPYVLDSDAIEEFKLVMGPDHAVEPDSLRFFDRNVLPHNQWDAKRHRKYQVSSFVRGTIVPRTFLNEFGDLARKISNRFPVSNEIRKIEQELMRVGLRDRREALQKYDDSGDIWSLPLVDAPFEPQADASQTGLKQLAALNSEVSTQVHLEFSNRLKPEATPSLLDTDGPVSSKIDLQVWLRTLLKIPADQLIKSEHLEQLERDLSHGRSLSSARQLEIRKLEEENRSLQDERMKQQRLSESLDGEIEELFQALDEKDLEITSIGVQMRDYSSKIEDLQIENIEYLESLVEVERKNRNLHKQIAIGRNPEVLSYEIVDARDSVPETFAELITSVSMLSNVQVTWDEDQLRELDRHEPISGWAQKSWAVLCALDDYAQAKLDRVWEGNIHSYLGRTPDGYRTYQLSRHAATESHDVQTTPKYAESRRFRVPDEVNATGFEYMWAHFKIANSGQVSPRLHYFDATKNTAKVIVGYLGRHLPTQLSDA